MITFSSLQNGAKKTVCLPYLEHIVVIPKEKRSLFFEFSYVCPEPVLVKCSFLHMNGSKRPFLLTTGGYPSTLAASTPLSIHPSAKQNKQNKSRWCVVVFKKIPCERQSLSQ